MQSYTKNKRCENSYLRNVKTKFFIFWKIIHWKYSNGKPIFIVFLWNDKSFVGFFSFFCGIKKEVMKIPPPPPPPPCKIPGPEWYKLPGTERLWMNMNSLSIEDNLIHFITHSRNHYARKSKIALKIFKHFSHNCSINYANNTI